MSKVFIISFDDGTIWDGRFVQLLNKHNMKGTFNLNSGLEDFVWELDGFPVRRQKLADTVDQYQGHEVASHTLTHPYLDSLPDHQLEAEVGRDCDRIKEIFGLDRIGFAVPFTACGEREIQVIKKYLRYIRLSEESETFDLPKDPYHIPIHALFNQPDVKKRIEDFAKNPLEDSVFVLAGHSYELEAYDQWEYMDKLLGYIGSFGFEHMTTMEFAEKYFNTQSKGACLVCGKPLKYYETSQEMECIFCHEKFESYASCEDGHYVCDTCHAKKGVDAIMDFCLKSQSINPLEMLHTIMNDPYIYMHGPEHHIMVGAVLLTAYKNAGGNIDLAAALDEMKSRGNSYPGGSCGYWGCCGAAVSTGMFISIITKATPLTGKSWGQSNRMTAKSLQAIGDIGGPRCCKRNSFTAIRMAVQFVKEEFGINLELPDEIKCNHSDRNKQCLRRKCPYYNF